MVEDYVAPAIWVIVEDIAHVIEFRSCIGVRLML